MAKSNRRAFLKKAPAVAAAAVVAAPATMRAQAPADKPVKKIFRNGKPAPATQFPPVEGLMQADKPVPGFSSAELANGQPSVVNFWASWCVPCRRSFPWLNTMQRKYGKDGLQIIAVNLDKDRALADGFLAEVPAEFSLRFDPAGALAKQFGVQTMPSSFLIDADGKVLASHFGFRSSEAADYESSIQAALDTAGAAQ